MSTDLCCNNPPTPNPNAGGGVVQQLGGLNCYISGTADSKISVLFISDIYGFEAPKFRKLADKVADAGFYTVAPDFFRGDPYDMQNPSPSWIERHSPKQGSEDAKSVIEALKSKGITKIGAAGFCWGGKVVVELAKHLGIEVGVLLHPVLLSVDDIRGVKVPISILGAEFDPYCPLELVKQLEIALRAKPEIDSFVKIYPGMEHGWTIRYNDDDDAAIKSAEEAHKDMLDWLAKYLK